jgi:hypothetical protein
MRQLREVMDSRSFPMDDAENGCLVDRARQGVMQPNTKVQYSHQPPVPAPAPAPTSTIHQATQLLPRTLCIIQRQDLERQDQVLTAGNNFYARKIAQKRSGIDSTVRNQFSSHETRARPSYSFRHRQPQADTSAYFPRAPRNKSDRTPR